MCVLVYCVVCWCDMVCEVEKEDRKKRKIEKRIRDKRMTLFNLFLFALHQYDNMS